MPRFLAPLALALAVSAPAAESFPPHFSGIYPHLSFFNEENECGTGAIVSWMDRLWVITYAPHMPKGSSDKLYEIDRDLNLTVRPESIGGTAANRMIHRESSQLFIGPYAIDADRNVRAIPYTTMFGRHTGNARHLNDPANKIYYATMEEGFYEVDVKTLELRTLFFDEQRQGTPKADLPGYHGKGFYSGQGRVVYANNGEHGGEAQRNPFVASGVLAQWDGSVGAWGVVRRNQFTEVTGPGGIQGNPHPDQDPIWSMGWDARSLILMCLDGGTWHRYRLPKASHSYDGAHGWNTEWPRIREIGEGSDFLMTMHGMFWHFPRSFSAGNTAGIAPRSTYLKVVGDFCRWGDQVVLGCDDTAKSEFLNKRKAKGQIAAPQSQSNLWFVRPEQLDSFGPLIGRGAVWLDDAVTPNEASEPYLFSGFRKRAVHLVTDAKTTLTFEIDPTGKGEWTTLATKEVEGYAWHSFEDDAPGIWIRVRSSAPLTNATVWFTYGGEEARAPTAKFDGLAKAGDRNVTGGIVRARGENKRDLHFASEAGLYALDAQARLTRVEDEQAEAWLKKNAAIPDRKGVLEIDAASVLYLDDTGKRFRLPKGDAAFDTPGPLGWGRLCREIATERDLFNCHGTFYELPAENAGGFARVRPVSTHNLRLSDYCSYRGLMVISGVNPDFETENPHLIRSDDGKTALWVGAIDDIWELGKPVGKGGPWKESAVEVGVPSDPYLMTGYDRKTVRLSSSNRTTITAEINLTGNGEWQTWKAFELEGEGETITYAFPDSFQAYWIRFRSSNATSASAQLSYE
jgi:hypothetical protein